MATIESGDAARQYGNRYPGQGRWLVTGPTTVQLDRTRRYEPKASAAGVYKENDINKSSNEEMPASMGVAPYLLAAKVAMRFAKALRQLKSQLKSSWLYEKSELADQYANMQARHQVWVFSGRRYR